jgi:hypothetical protein
MILVAKKLVTRQQVETAKHRAELFVANVLGDEDRADEIANQNIDEWAKDTGRKITNPEGKTMVNGTTKADLQDVIDQACDLLNDAYTPEASREIWPQRWAKHPTSCLETMTMQRTPTMEAMSKTTKPTWTESTGVWRALAQVNSGD